MKIVPSSFLLATILLGSTYNLISQVAINDTGALPDPNAILDISCSTNDKGVLIPRMTSAQIAAMGSVATGMMIFNTDAGDVQFYQGATWEPVGSVDNKTLYSGSDTLASNIIVTQLGSKLAFTASSVNAFSVDSNSFSVDAANHRVGIGTETPESTLHISGNSGTYSSTGTSNAPLYVQTSASTDLPVNAYFNATGGTDSFIRHRFANNGNNKWEVSYSDLIDFAADTLSDGTWRSVFKISDIGTITINDTYTFPATDGTANQVLETNGSGVLSWVDQGSGTVTLNGTQTLTNKTIDADSNSLSNIEDADIKVNAAIDASKIGDGTVSNTEFLYLASLSSGAVGITDTLTLTNKTLTTPHIGTSINDTLGNELIIFGSTPSAVNSIRIDNSLTAVGPILSTDGDDTNIDLNIETKGSGAVIIKGLKFPTSDGTANQYLKTDGTGSLTWDSLDVPSSWQNVTFENSWTDYGSGFETCQYYKDKTGIVHIKGVVSGAAASTVIFTLPAGCRPAAKRLFVVNGNDGFTSIEVGADGTVIARPGDVTFTSLEISFRP